MQRAPGPLRGLQRWLLSAMVRAVQVATTSSSDRDTAVAAERLARACAVAARRAGLSFLIFLISVPFLRVSDPPFVDYSLPSRSLPPTSVPALIILHRAQRTPSTSTSSESTLGLHARRRLLLEPWQKYFRRWP